MRSITSNTTVITLQGTYNCIYQKDLNNTQHAANLFNYNNIILSKGSITIKAHTNYKLDMISCLIVSISIMLQNSTL